MRKGKFKALKTGNDWAEAFARAWWGSLVKCWQPPSTTMTGDGLNPTYNWLVVSTPAKNMSSSVGMILPKIWIQTTNQTML